MDIYKQIIILLITIVCVIIVVIMAIIKSKNKPALDVTKIGLKVGEYIPEIDYKDINDTSRKIEENFLNDSRILIIMDSNCKECMKLMQGLEIVNSEYLKLVKFVFTETEISRHKVSNYNFNKNAIFIDAKNITNDLKVNAFPFYYVININGEIVSKGTLSAYNLIEFITENELSPKLNSQLA
ncbi:hypothetical protein D3C74_202540 [compost metagenome]